MIFTLSNGRSPFIGANSVGVARGWDPGGGIIMICPTNAYRAVLVDIDLKKKFALIALVINHHSPRLLLQGKVAPKHTFSSLK